MGRRARSRRQSRLGVDHHTHDRRIGGGGLRLSAIS
jgi:hypothetical protein